MNGDFFFLAYSVDAVTRLIKSEKREAFLWKVKVCLGV